MKVKYIKVSDSQLEVPEHSAEFERLFGDLWREGFSIEDGMYVVMEDNIEEKTTEYILFADDKHYEDFVGMFNKFNLLIESRDITLEVKSKKCEIPLFIKYFKTSREEREELEVVKSEITSGYCLDSAHEQYLFYYTKVDDVLDKIKVYGIESLDDNDNRVLIGVDPEYDTFHTTEQSIRRYLH
jgi:hypothetical protein